MRRAATTTSVVAALFLSLTACTASAPDPAPVTDPAPTTDPAPGPGPTPEEEPETAAGTGGVVVDTDVQGAAARLEVGPVVREGDLAVLPVTVEATGDADVGVATAFGFVFNDIYRVAPDNLRVVDTVALTVSPAARDGRGRHVVEAVNRARPADGPVTFHMVLAAPARDTVAVLVPHVGLVADVPVVDGGSEAAAGVRRSVSEVADEVGVELAEVEAPVVALDSYRVVDEGAVTTRGTEDLVTVALAADVLFAFDSAELGPDADGALTVAAGELADVGGELRVVGHTDDQGEAAYNERLSRDRAEAVAGRLGDLADLTGVEVSVEGRGSAEPAVPGRSEEARAANRRVEVLFTPAPAGAEDAGVVDDVEDRAVVDGEVPPARGASGASPDGVRVDSTQQPWAATVRVEEVRAVDRLMVGTVLLEPTEPAPVAWLVSQSAYDSRGDFAPQLQFAATGVTLLQGPERVFPLDYVQPGSDLRRPLAELALVDRAEPGSPARATVVWPRLAGDEVVVDVPLVSRMDGRVESGNPWRVTGVPVRGR